MSARKSKSQTIAEFLMQRSKSHPGLLFGYPQIAKEIYERRALPKHDSMECRSVQSVAGGVRKYLQENYGADLLVLHKSMRALVTDDDKVAWRVRNTGSRMSSAAKAHARAVELVKESGIHDRKLKVEFKDSYTPIAKLGNEIVTLLPSKKPK